MDEHQIRIERERLVNEAIERDLISRLTASKTVRLNNQKRAELIRSRIAELNRRIAQMKRVQVEE